MNRRTKRTLLISAFFFLTLVLIMVAGFLHDQSLWPYSHHRHPIEPFEVSDLRDSISELDTKIDSLEARRSLSFASDNSEARTRLDAETKIREAESIGGDFRGKQSDGGTLFIGHAYGPIDIERIPYPPLKSFLDKFMGNHEIARLVFLGDLTRKPKDTPAFIQFLKPYTATKIFVAGNHDNNLQLLIM
jgi:hypothetical protein